MLVRGAGVVVVVVLVALMIVELGLSFKTEVST